MILETGIRLAPMDGPEPTELSLVPAEPPPLDDPSGPLRQAIVRAREWLLARQERDGRWQTARGGDVAATCDLLLLWPLLGRDEPQLTARLVAGLRAAQRPAGGWALADKFQSEDARRSGTSNEEGGLDVGLSVRACLALKLHGVAGSDPDLRKARRAIVAAGGADRSDGVTRLWLAVWGQIEYGQARVAPPRRRDGEAGELAAARAVVRHCRYVAPAARRASVRELFLKSPADWPALAAAGDPASTPVARRPWAGMVRRLDEARARLAPSLARSGRRLQTGLTTDELAAVPTAALVWRAVALHATAERDANPRARRQRLRRICRQLRRRVVGDGATATLRRRELPLLETAVAVRWLKESGLPAASAPLARASGWLMRHAVATSTASDAQQTATALAALAERTERSATADWRPPPLQLVAGTARRPGGHATARPKQLPAVARQLMLRLTAAQRADGGWAADQTGEAERVDRAARGRSTAATTASALEALGRWGHRAAEPSVARGVARLRALQEADGGWSAADGAARIETTSRAVCGLLEVGVKRDDEAIAAAVNWLCAHQQEEGGWGPADSYAAAGDEAPPAPTETAAALLALLAAGLERHAAVARGIDWLLAAQDVDGGWAASGGNATPSGDAAADLHAAGLPLEALSRWALVDDSAPRPATRPRLRLRIAPEPTAELRVVTAPAGA